jgi:polyisoprenoid-binding protein YceI
MRLLLALTLSLAAPLAAATTAPAAAAAPTYTHAEGSSLGFASSYDGEAFAGRFAQFTTDIAFDPANATGRFDVVIALASAGTENEERDEVLLGAEFFNAIASPQARYTATRFRKLADGRFVADGTLSLRGVSKPVPLTFRWAPGATPKLDGTATVKRLDFNVGTGDWDDTEVMPDAVSVTTTLVLRAKR